MATKKISSVGVKKTAKAVKKVAKKTTVKKAVKRTAKKVATAKKTSRKSLIPRHTDKKSPMALHRLPDNPILYPLVENKWENWQTFNPGAVLIDDKVHFIYRAIGNDGVSRFGYAASFDGFTVDERLSDYVYEHRAPGGAYTFYSLASGGSFGGSEDPRLVRVGDEDKIYLTYTACDNGLRMALTSISVKDFLNKKWRWSRPVFLSPPNQVQKNWVIFPEKIRGKYAILHSINPDISIEYRDDLNFADGEYINSQYGGQTRKNSWDNWLRGAGAPPLKTKDGWLLLYHAMDDLDPGRYKVGVMLLDLENPEKILQRSPFPILEPDETYENNGYKAGVVYLSGAVIRDNDLLVYYGAADSYVCVAWANLDKFLTALKEGRQPEIRRAQIKSQK